MRLAVTKEFTKRRRLTVFKRDLEGQLYRMQEAFADAEPAASSPTTAQGLKEYRKLYLSKYGPGKGRTHPAADKWAELDADLVSLHTKRKEELSRKEELARKERLSQSSKRLRSTMEDPS